MSDHFFAGSFGGDNEKIDDATRLECKICWYVYDPAEGDTYWQIVAGTPFAKLPEHWTCPNCDGAKDGFLVLDDQTHLMPDPTPTEPRAIAAKLEAAFERVHRERMHDVPILNGALGVKAVGTREVEAGWLSALVTPWFINFMLVPRTPEQERTCSAAQLGATVAHVFPSGRFEFIVGEEADLGRYQMCSLFSPVLEFENQGAALITAESALALLFDARLTSDAPQAVDASSPDAAGEAELRPRSGREQRKAAMLSRRGLFFGRDAEAGDIEP